MTDLARATSILTIDVEAIVANWRLMAKGVAPAEAGAVVKADCYGLGMGHIAPALYAAGCRTFFVANVDEGLALRKILADGMIYVLSGPPPGSEPDFAAHGLSPVLNSLSQIAGWSAFARASRAAPAAAIHIDTGMSRLGLDEAELDRLAAHPEVLAGVRPVLVMSHLACADEGESPKNAEQLGTFRRLAARLPAMPMSLAASFGAFLGRNYHFDLVRPGVALYGVNPTPGRPSPMAQVVRLQGKILQVRDVDRPMTVGYGATHRVTRRGRIATVAIGYADGWFRSLGGRGFGLIEGIKVPVVGRISMDLTTFDVTEVPPTVVHAGAMMELIGPSHSVEDVADEAGTISYEILTALGRRHHRRWIGVPAEGKHA